MYYRYILFAACFLMNVANATGPDEREEVTAEEVALMSVIVAHAASSTAPEQAPIVDASSKKTSLVMHHITPCGGAAVYYIEPPRSPIRNMQPSLVWYGCP